MIRSPSRFGRSQRRGFQSRFILLAIFLAFATCLFFFTRTADLHIVPYARDARKAHTSLFDHAEKPLAGAEGDDTNADIPYWELNADDIKFWRDPDDPEDPNDVESGTEKDGKGRDAGAVSRLQEEKDKRKLWRYIYRATANLKSSNQIYGKTLATLDHKENRTEELSNKLIAKPDSAYRVGYSMDEPVYFNPYPSYNSDDWKAEGLAPFVECNGANDEPIENIMVFKGRPRDFPENLMGSYKALNLDPNICWERETRLGIYGLRNQKMSVNGRVATLKWDNVNWGKLQRNCTRHNALRYPSNVYSDNPYLSVYPETQKFTTSGSDVDNIQVAIINNGQIPVSSNMEVRTDNAETLKSTLGTTASKYKKEDRTALLLRSYTGKTYTESDKQNIRALITELSLKTGGQYEVFLLVQDKDNSKDIFESRENYMEVLNKHVPLEFHSITVLWNDQTMKKIYTEMQDDSERDVHTAQWLSVQKFSYDHPEFEYMWNWEMDFRYTGHHYDLLDNIHQFARKQPRKGLWERNERWYIPKYHGDYDTTFRESIEQQYGDEIVWGAPDLPFIRPQGPKPPGSPSEDNYEWGVNEDADIITVGPMFNPVNSLWIISDHIWGYNDDKHRKEDTPRRTTIVTHSRISKRLLSLMHVENMRGNHVASEMTPQTVALLHGLKGVYAPHPVFMDRKWTSSFVNQWFNAGPDGAAGGYGSAMGWGRERRYQGTTWYYRAEPPNRLFNNWMGWADTGLGGASWERYNGRPCLPSIMLHPIKDSEPTEKGHETGFDLGYG